ncbi:MAG: RecQ family ATP-dependent DNA helicase, partial [Bacteriovorax sp.]
STDTGIVYCLSRDKVERVAGQLKKLGHPAIPYHAGLSKEERLKNQELFNTEERIIVVATIAFGMGIDRPDVRFVAHLDLPKSIESYYQETGRAGRDGKASSAWMIYGLQDVVKLSQMLETTDADENYKKVARFKLDCMLALCEAGSCRRRYLLQYFGEIGLEKCGNCDTCINPPQMWDATIDAQKMLSTIYRTGQTFGAGHIIEVIRGSKNAKVIERKHNNLSVYGIGKEQTKEHWSSLLRQLLNMNYIAIKNWEYRSLGLTNKAQDIFSGAAKLELRKQEFVPEKEKTGRKDKKSTKDTAGLHGRQGLFDSLKDLRNKIAKEKNIPSYIVFNDKSLHDMCALMPRDDSEFLMVHGVGQNKLENYGKAFLEIIRTYS